MHVLARKVTTRIYEYDWIWLNMHVAHVHGWSTHTPMFTQGALKLNDTRKSWNNQAEKPFQLLPFLHGDRVDSQSCRFCSTLGTLWLCGFSVIGCVIGCSALSFRFGFGGRSSFGPFRFLGWRLAGRGILGLWGRFSRLGLWGCFGLWLCGRFGFRLWGGSGSGLSTGWFLNRLVRQVFHLWTLIQILNNLLCSPPASPTSPASTLPPLWWQVLASSTCLRLPESTLLLTGKRWTTRIFDSIVSLSQDQGFGFEKPGMERLYLVVQSRGKTWQ